MSVQRILNTRCGSYGWQARAHVAPGWRLTRFFADDQHGGKRAAYEAAQLAELELKRQAKRLQKKGRPA